MGWSRKAKFGMHTGSTLRKGPAHKYCRNGSYGENAMDKCGEFAIVKELLNYGPSSQETKLKILDERFGLNDGIPMAEFSTMSRRNYPSSPVVHSMNKHKRWMLLDMVKDYAVEEHAKKSVELSQESNSSKPAKKRRENEESPELCVTIVERHSGSFMGITSPDCVQVTSTNPSWTEPVRSSTRNHAHVGDLRGTERDDNLELYYEFLSEYPQQKWPCNRQVRCYPKCSYEVKGKKSRNKCKGRRNKNRVGNSGVPPFDIALEKEALKKDYTRVHPASNTGHLSTASQFPIGSYIHTLIEESLEEKQTDSYLEPHSCQSTKSEHVYGKGDAIYIDNPDDDSSSNVNINNAENVTDLQNWNVSSDMKAEIQVIAADLESSNLIKEFGDNYIEGEVCPRKFIIKTDLKENSENSSSSPAVDMSVLFEAIKKDTLVTLNTKVVDMKVSVSLPREVFSNEETVTQAIYSELNSLEQTGALSIDTIVTTVSEKCIESCAFVSQNQSGNKKRKHPEMDKISTQVIHDICQQKPEICGLKKAFRISTKEDTGVTDTKLCCKDRMQADDSHCGICFSHVEELDQSAGFTRLLRCSHAFCQECWTYYISSCIQDGHGRVLCPSYECSTWVSEPQVWAATNSGLYRRYNSLHYRHAIATNPKLRSCPAPGCEHLVYVPHPRGASLPVHCGCGEIWCFHCMQAAHWPASCREAEVFRKKHGDYEELKKFYMDQNRITSVPIKRCPFCNYPIYKNVGCQHMSCRCGREFCWECLDPWDGHEWPCGARIRKHEEVELSDVSGNARYAKYCKVANMNFQERYSKKMKAFTKMVRRTKRLENCHRLVLEDASVRGSRLVRSCVANSIASHLEAMFHFKYLAHTVMENTAVAMAVARRTRMVGRLDKELQRLTFVVDRFDEIFLNPRVLTNCRNLEKAVELLKSGERLIKDIHKLVRANRKLH